MILKIKTDLLFGNTKWVITEHIYFLQSFLKSALFCYLKKVKTVFILFVVLQMNYPFSSALNVLPFDGLSNFKPLLFLCHLKVGKSYPFEVCKNC